MGTIRKKGNSYFVDFYVHGKRIRLQRVCKSKLAAEILLDFIEGTIEASELYDCIVDKFSDRFLRQRFINYSNGQELLNFYESIRKNVSLL